MKLYMTHCFSESSEKFLVFDERKNLKYTVLVSYTSFFVKLEIYNNTRRIAKIRSKNIFSLCAFNISCRRKLCIKNNITIVVNMLNLKNYFFIYGINWFFRGDLLKKNFEIVNADKSVVMRQIKYEKYNKSFYEIDINDTKNELLCICVALCVDILEARSTKVPLKAANLIEWNLVYLAKNRKR